METQLESPRRFRIHDAIVLIAVSAVAMLSAKDRWLEVIPVVQKLEIARVFDRTYLEEIFQGQMRSGRMDSVRIQFMHMVGPSQGPWGIIAWQNGSPAALENWALTHASPSALGFALAQDVYFLVFPFLILWSLCFMVLRLIRPRPPWSAVFRQPGWWACFGAIVGAVLEMAVETFTGLPAPSVIVPATAVVAWLALALSMKWKAESSWIDRAGRLVGLLWAGAIPVYLAGFVFS